MNEKFALMGYLEGVLLAEMGLSLLKGNAQEDALDAAKEVAEKMNEQNIDSSPLSQEEKERLKSEGKVRIETMLKGYKDILKREGRLDNK